MTLARTAAAGLTALCLTAAAPPAEAAGECFLGTWTGEIDRLKSADGPARKLIVRSVDADGSAKANWGLPTTANPPAVSNAKVEGDKITFLTGPGGKVEATCSGSKLSGTWSYNSKPYFFDMKKQP